MHGLFILLCAGTMTVCAYQLGRFTERYHRWGEALDRLRAFRFQDQHDSDSQTDKRP